MCITFNYHTCRQNGESESVPYGLEWILAFLIMSYINTKLRDVYHSLDALCDDMHIQRPELETRLAEAGFTYDPDVNKFW